MVDARSRATHFVLDLRTKLRVDLEQRFSDDLIEEVRFLIDGVLADEREKEEEASRAGPGVGGGSGGRRRAEDAVKVGKIESAEAVGTLDWGDMKITWAVYAAAEVQRSAIERPELRRRVAIKCEFRADDGLEYEAFGEHFVDPIAFVRNTDESWRAKLVDMARATVESAVKAAALH